MAENSRIGWTDHTFNPWIGCAKVSPGCKNCYAEVDTFARRERSHGRELWGPHANRHRTSAAYWKKPLTWNKASWYECDVCGWRGVAHAEALCRCGHPVVRVMKPTRQRVFCASMADVFEDRPDLSLWRDDLFKLIEQTPNLDWLILTKRPENVKRTLPDNVWLGVSVENQTRAQQRIPILQKIDAKIKFLSCEPMISYIDLSMAVEPDEDAWDEVNAAWDDDDEPEEFVPECEAECDWVNYGNNLVENPEHREWEWRRRESAGFKTLKHGVIDWVICGGESGPHRREMELQWAEILYNECKQAGIPFYMKQDSASKPGQQGRLSDLLWNVKEFPKIEEQDEDIPAL